MYSTNSIIYIHVIWCPRGPIYWEKLNLGSWVCGLESQSRTRARCFPIRTNLGRHITSLLFFYRIAFKWPKIFITIIKPAFILMPLVIRVYNHYCLTLSKIMLYNSHCFRLFFEALTKAWKVAKVGNFRVVCIQGSDGENLRRCQLANQIQRFRILDCWENKSPEFNLFYHNKIQWNIYQYLIVITVTFIRNIRISISI